MAQTRLLPLVRNHYEWANEFAVPIAPVVVRKWDWKGEFIRHDHDFWEIQFCTDGEAVHCSLDGEQLMQPGDVFVLRPGASHAFKNCQNLCAYVCCFAHDILRHELSWTVTEPRLNLLLWRQDSMNGSGVTSLHLQGQSARDCCEAQLQALERFGEEKVFYERARGIGHLLLLLAELADQLPAPVSDCSPPMQKIDPAKKARSHRALQKGIYILQEELAEEWTADALARRLGIENSYLGRLFRSGLGLPPMAFLARCRAERAACLLLQSNLSIAEIGARVGWPDPNHFARRFRQHYGISASAYRNSVSKMD